MNKKQTNKQKRLNLYLTLAFIFALILIFTPKTLSGMPEIDNKLLVTIIALDKADDKIKVTGTAIMPGENQTPSVNRATVSGEGRSVSEALDQISVKNGKPVELGLCGAVIVGSGFESESVIPHLNYLVGSGKIIPGAYLLHSPVDTGENIIKMNNNLSKASSNGISKVVEYNAVSTNVATTTILRYLSTSASVSGSAYMPCIKLSSDDGKAKNKQGKSQSGGQSGEQSGEQGEEKSSEISGLDSVALYKNGVRCALLSEEETKGYVWTDIRSTLGLVTLDKLSVNGKDFYNIPAQLLRKKFEIKCSFNNGKPTAKLKLNLTLGYDSTDVINQIYKEFKLSGKKMENLIKNGFIEQIKSSLKTAMNALKKYDCDSVGIVDKLYKFCHSEYKKYPNKSSIFDDIELEYEVSVRFA
ncbi:MAG: hypothetical protein IKC64_05715 [Clostridia bacterium]|nr:hypothetical protein [Clostridia bacterium]